MKKAFVLIELLIVIAIIAILAGVIFVNLNSARNRAKDTQVKSDMSELSKALEVIKVDRDLGVVNWSYLTATGTNDASISNWKDIDGKALIAKLPENPNSDSTLLKRYRIRIMSGSNYAIIGRLSKNTSTYWCVYNGAGREVTGSDISTAQNTCDG